MKETDTLQRRYDAGELDAIKEDLAQFIVVHRGEIGEFQKERERLGSHPVEDDVAVKLFILRQRTVNAKRDISDQLEEIQKEKWIQGVQMGREPDPDRVTMEWVSKYSASWRAHRLTSIVYVLEREKERYLELFRSSS